MSSQKRGPQGSCAGCQATIPKKLRYCADCSRLRAEQKRKTKEGIVTIRTPTGTIEIKPPSVFISSEHVFSVSPRSLDTLTPKASLGAFVDVLLGILRENPEYLHRDDINRHFFMLYQFQQHKMRRMGWTTDIIQSVSEFPLVELEYALRFWVDSYVNQKQHPLMSTYAIDSAQFALAHAYGHMSWSDFIWRLSPIFPSQLVDQSKSQRSFFEDPQFKRRVTDQIGRLLVLVKVPPQARCVHPSSGDTLTKAGTQFLFEVQRCHLSSGFNDYMHLKAVDDAEPRMDLSANFRLYGKVIVRSADLWDYRLSAPSMPEELTSPRITNDPGLHNALGEIPVRWITHTIIRDDQETRLEPVPNWRP